MFGVKLLETSRRTSHATSTSQKIAPKPADAGTFDDAISSAQIKLKSSNPESGDAANPDLSKTNNKQSKKPEDSDAAAPSTDASVPAQTPTTPDPQAASTPVKKKDDSSTEPKDNTDDDATKAAANVSDNPVPDAAAQEAAALAAVTVVVPPAVQSTSTAQAKQNTDTTAQTTPAAPVLPDPAAVQAPAQHKPEHSNKKTSDIPADPSAAPETHENDLKNEAAKQDQATPDDVDSAATPDQVKRPAASDKSRRNAASQVNSAISKDQAAARTATAGITPLAKTDDAAEVASQTPNLALDTKAAPAANVVPENVSVVAPKELHSAEAAHAAQESPAPSSNDTMDQIVLGLKGKLDPKTGKAEISLDPPNLGHIKVSISLDQGVLTADFHATTDLVRDLLKSNLDSLKTVLQNQGVAVDRLAVEPAPQQAGSQNAGQNSSGNAAHDGRSAGQYQQDGRQSGQRRTDGDAFARMVRQVQDATPFEMVA